MTLSDVQALWGLSGKASATGTNTTGKVKIGPSNGLQAWTDADILYSFQVTATGAGDVATLTLLSGVVAQTTGTPTIADGDGNDFEGVTLPTMLTLYGLLIEAPSTNTDAVAVVPAGTKGTALPDINSRPGKAINNLTITDVGLVSETLAFTLVASGDVVTVTVLGKSS